MSLMDSIVNLVYGTPPKFKIGESVLICTVDGCMAEKLTIRKKGHILDKILIPCYNGKDIPGIKVGYYDGTTSNEFVERIRRLNDGRLVVAN